ncbi:phytase [Aquidulcibacter sp.]|uniref:phytase n=1 Tax=Aquidulcibacter sp. TaxID=2052990 RepID=UPI0025C4D54E|nr:phytase [Aquidulcibacter sp.]MCA3693546.1 phytase [Aquidulcibacter sp.]
MFRATHFVLVPACLSLVLAGCATELPLAERIARATPAVTVVARGETVPVGSANQDAADDPAIWRNPARPEASLIIGTDKKAGLYAYDLNGKIRDFYDAGRVNNVDLRANILVADTPRILVAASDRNDLTQAKIALFTLDAETAKLAPIGTVPAGTGEAYGICLGHSEGKLYAFMVLKDGTIHQIALDLTGPAPSGEIVRSLKLATQSEGCVVDEQTQRLYVAEEDVGLWRFDARPTGSTSPTKIASADGKNIVADAEGVALAEGPEGGRYILVSSQGDNAYTIFRASDEAYVGRFRIAEGTFGATEETDGIELIVGDFGPAYPGGLFIAQDGIQAGGAQNFKLVAWDDIKTAVGLPR